MILMKITLEITMNWEIIEGIVVTLLLISIRIFGIIMVIMVIARYCGCEIEKFFPFFQSPPRDAGQGGEMSIAPGTASSARN